jgi:CheY-like chemotaxis protein
MVERPLCAAVVFSPQSSLAYFLKGVLDCAGLAVTAAVSDYDELDAVVRGTPPDVIVYDVSFPFAANWQKLQELRSRPAFRRVPVIVTTSEARELFRATGCSSAIEIFARPDDVSGLRNALLGAIQGIAPMNAA